MNDAVFYTLEGLFTNPFLIRTFHDRYWEQERPWKVFEAPSPPNDKRVVPVVC